MAQIKLSVFLLAIISLIWSPTLGSTRLHVSGPADARNYYIWCWTAPLNPDIQQRFYSGIFVGSWPQWEVNGAFGKYVQRNYPKSNTGPGRCSYNVTPDNAEASKSRDKDNAAHFDKLETIETEWIYQP